MQIHRTHLVAHVAVGSQTLTAYAKSGAALLAHAGMGTASAPQVSMALTNAMVNRQATMLAYNDVSWLFGILFLCTIPMAFYLPSRSVLKPARQL